MISEVSGTRKYQDVLPHHVNPKRLIFAQNPLKKNQLILAFILNDDRKIYIQSFEQKKFYWRQIITNKFHPFFYRKIQLRKKWQALNPKKKFQNRTRLFATRNITFKRYDM